MLCCIAFAFVIGLVRQGWRSLTFRGESESTAPLPPPARRPQPGEAGVTDGAVSPERAEVRHWETGIVTRARAALELRFAAVGIVLYVSAVALLLLLDAAANEAPAAGWLARDALYAAFALMALVLARNWGRGSRSPEGRERIACALMGIGAVWLELGLVDQHLFGLFDIAHGSLAWDALFHGAGAAALAAGWILLVAADERRRAWRHAPSSAS